MAREKGREKKKKKKTTEKGKKVSSNLGCAGKGNKKELNRMMSKKELAGSRELHPGRRGGRGVAGRKKGGGGGEADPGWAKYTFPTSSTSPTFQLNLFTIKSCLSRLPERHAQTTLSVCI